MSDERVDGRTLRYQHRRGEILDAVLEHLLEHGIHDTSIRKLAAAVGISHVTLRHHFGTRDELLVEVGRLIRAREPVPESVGDHPDAPEEIIRELWAWWTAPENLRYLRLMYEAYGLALQKPDLFQGVLQSTDPLWLDDARRLALSAGCPEDEVEAFATLLVAQLRGLLLDILTSGDEERVGTGLDLLIRSLAAERLAWVAG